MRNRKLYLFDSYQRQKVEFYAIDKTCVGIYACGPTVYDYAHVGNLRTYLMVDLLRRTLAINGYKVNHVMNITDVGHLVSDGDEGEDKMEKGARIHQRSAWEIATYFEGKFFEDLTHLNILTPNIVCRATEHIQQQIEFIGDIEAKGFTYQTADGVYFDTGKIEDYGYLARLDVSGLQAGIRVALKHKKNITDFALWKFSGTQKRQMSWQSPWGEGFPGWHIECSAMAEQYLGKLFDIHLGGEDHIAVHHSNEIAQSQARHKTRLANYWMHGYFLQMDQKKIAKSGQSLRLLKLIERGYDPLAYRYLVLTAHYRSRLNFTWESLAAASKALQRIRRKIAALPDGGTSDKSLISEFLEKINNDLDTPQALTVFLSVFNRDISDETKKATLLLMDQVLGLKLAEKNVKEDEVPPTVIQLAEQREYAREQKNWSESDRLREALLEQGYRIDDLTFGYKISAIELSIDE